MILSLPRKISLLTSREYVVKDNAALSMKESQNGITIFGDDGRPVAQIQHKGSSTTVAVVDCGCLEIVRKGKRISLVLPEFVKDRTDGEPTFEENEFDFFGDVRTPSFTVYRKKAGQSRPDLLVQASPHLYDPNLFSVYVPYTEHGTLAVAICMGLVGK